MKSIKNILYCNGLLCLMGTLLLVAGCGNMTNGKPAAEQKMAEFHVHYNSSDFEWIYNNAHDNFRSSTSLEDFQEFMGAVRGKLGKMSSTVNKGWNINTYNFVTSAVLQQQTEFEHGTGMETFNFIIKDEQALLVGYNINSRELIVK